MRLEPIPSFVAEEAFGPLALAGVLGRDIAVASVPGLTCSTRQDTMMFDSAPRV